MVRKPIHIATDAPIIGASALAPEFTELSSPYTTPSSPCGVYLANSALMLNPDYLAGIERYVESIGKKGKE